MHTLQESAGEDQKETGVELATAPSMLARLGFVASVVTENISTSSTCRLVNATRSRLRGLIRENLDALHRVVGFLERRDILLYRISSGLIPFGSHPVNTLKWWEEFAADFDAVGRRLRHLGVRVSMHPGQFTVLNSRSPDMVESAVAELEYHARLLDLLGVGAAAKIVVHVGGMQGGSEEMALDRFCSVAARLPDAVRRRLVVENDDRLFDAEAALSVGRRVRIPVVFDWLHHKANRCRAPLDELLPEIFETWTRKDGRPKVHLSSQTPGGPPGAHAALIDPADALALFDVVPPQPFDCMLEAKEKDRALLKLREDLRRRGVVERDVPPRPRSQG